jgi:hypothetical protein
MAAGSEGLKKLLLTEFLPSPQSPQSPPHELIGQGQYPGR